MTTRTSRFVIAAACFVVGAVSGAVSAQDLFSVDAGPILPERPDELRGLSPELWAAVRNDRTLVGLVQGRVVLQLRPDEIVQPVTEQDAAISRVGGRRVNRLDIEPVTSLIVHPAQGWIPARGQAVGRFPVRSAHPRGVFGVVDVTAELTPGVIREVLADPRVARVEINNRFELHAAEDIPPKDQLFTQQWGLESAQVPHAWRALGTSSTAVVAVIDSGMDHSTPDLPTSVLWVNASEAANTSGTGDPDNNGYEGDVNGWPFVGTSLADTYGHGTFVASIIGALANNGCDATKCYGWPASRGTSTS